MDPRSVTLHALLKRVKAEGCTVALAGERLRLAAPRPLPLSLLEAVRARKSEIISMLQQQAALASELFEERAAILEHEGGLPRQEAERLALAQTGIEVDAGSTPAEPMRSSDVSSQAPCQAPEPATPENDGKAMLALLAREGPMSYGVAARALGWGATRAWQAGARLKAVGRIRHDYLGRMVPFPAEGSP